MDQLDTLSPWREQARRTAAEVATRPDAIRHAATAARMARMEAIVDEVGRLLAEASRLVAAEVSR